MPKLSADALDDRRKHILRAAEVCFARDGFHRTTIADVRDEAGVSTGAIYTYFPNKEAMIRAILEQARLERATQLLEAASGVAAASPLHLLLDWVRHVFTAEGEHRARVDVNLWAEALREPSVGDIARGALVEASEAVASVVAGRLREEAPGVDARAAAQVLVGLFLGLEVQRAVGVPIAPKDIDRMLTVLFELGPTTDASPRARPRKKARRKKSR